MTGWLDSNSVRKARGAFFTPPALARFVAKWAIRSADDQVLEPSCGEAAFLLAAAGKLSLLGSKFEDPEQLTGVELHALSADSARVSVEEAGATSTIRVGDFFSESPQRLYDVVIGNPPFIRYQEFSGEMRTRSLEAALAQGVRLSGLASSWAAFTIHASQFVKEDGRLGLVLPAELLTVGYAAEVRRYLLRRFAKVRLVLFEQRVFPEVLEDTILLLAEGTGGATHFEVYQAKCALDLDELAINGWRDSKPDATDRWTPALIDGAAYAAYEDATACANVGNLTEWGSAYLGAVTGNNGYFCLSYDEVKKHGLGGSELRRISPPGARHLKGVTFSTVAWSALRNEGKRVYLFRPDENPSVAALKFIESGEAAGVHKTYKCRVRAPWWRVPLPKRPDFFLTYMNNERLRFVRNEADVDILNSVYGFNLNKTLARGAAELLPIAMLNSITLLSAELCGRVHGGGLLKHEPRDLDKLATPSEACLRNGSAKLGALSPQIGRLLRKGDLDGAVRLVDRTLLIETARLSEGTVLAISNARERLLKRRLAMSGRIG